MIVADLFVKKSPTRNNFGKNIASFCGTCAEVLFFKND
jgi:hypothetical protein